MVAYGVSLCQVLPGGSLSCGLFDPLGAVCGVWWPFRGFACGSPAVIEKFDPHGAEGGWGFLSAGSLLSPAVIEKFDRFAAARLSEASWGGGAVTHRACGGSVACGDGICSVVRPLWGRRWMGVPFRGFASLTRGYRVVRPLWGRCLRDMQLTRVSLPHHAYGVPSSPGGLRHHAHVVPSWRVDGREARMPCHHGRGDRPQSGRTTL